MQDEAAIDVGGGKVRVDLDCLTEVGNRAIAVTLFIPDQGAIAVDIGIGEAEPDRPIQVDERLVKLPFASPQNCPVTEYGGVVWVNADRLIVVSERTLGGACFIQGVAADIVSFRVIGVEPDRLIELSDRAQEIAAAVRGQPPLFMEFGIVRWGLRGGLRSASPRCSSDDDADCARAGEGEAAALIDAA